jgi:predicted NBD/HSP70 family sugar kinase
VTVVGSQDPWFQVSEIVRLIRTQKAQTRPELVDATRLGRNVVTLRLKAAHQLGLIAPAGAGRSRGGRAAELWKFRSDVGHILVGAIGVKSLRVALADLGGTVLRITDMPWSVQRGPEATCAQLATAMDDLLRTANIERPWGITIGMPAPVDFTTGRNADPIASTETAQRWPADFDTRRWFSGRFKVPAWTESVSNLGALGAATTPGASDDLVFVRLGTGIGAGIVSRGEVHRGAHWLAGVLSHVTVRDDPDRICMCGRTGCLDAYAAGWALLGDAQRVAAQGRSPYLSAIAAERDLTVDDLTDGARRGEPACIEIVVRAADALGRALGPMITWFNPGEIIVGGYPIVRDPLFRTVLERAINATALPASVAELRLRTGDPDEHEPIIGAAELATEALLSPGFLVEWGPTGSPLNSPGLIDRDQQV